MGKACWVSMADSCKFVTLWGLGPLLAILG